ncbi:MAG: DegV family protein [Christensenellaceae bacterium]|jgi:DegV family protein with EDD domain|nr:DegV family protein [Christensenellaceae bacterium]
MALRYFSDSCADLPKAYAQRRGLTILPMPYSIEGRDYLDDFGESLPYHDFYEKLRAGLAAQTAQISAERFKEAFMPCLQGGDDVFYLAFSSKLSGTYNSARLAALELEEEFPGRRVYVVDSLSASMGQGLLMDHILDLRDEGRPAEEITAWAEENKGRLCHWFTVSDLDFLKRGGRVSSAAAFFGTMLSIKPVLHVDDEGGLTPVQKTQGRAKSIRALFEHLKDTAFEPSAQRIFISHGDHLADAESLAKMLREELGVSDIQFGYIGPLVGSHSGPDTIALFFLGEPR